MQDYLPTFSIFKITTNFCIMDLSRGCAVADVAFDIIFSLSEKRFINIYIPPNFPRRHANYDVNYPLQTNNEIPSSSPS